MAWVRVQRRKGLLLALATLQIVDDLLVLPNPCKDGEPLLSPEREPVICGGEDTCTAGYFCHVGSSPETTNCCPGSEKL
ncbi:unnamed protein product, partial [Mesorhabditis belari]|uniref:Uncharacterized protein n=1 Tax=Mesorhabditis belari TaxID=2138241 RepID=A0AAF3FAZ8_9BILA